METTKHYKVLSQLKGATIKGIDLFEWNGNIEELTLILADGRKFRLFGDYDSNRREGYICFGFGTAVFEGV